jgi:transglutaminase-like putative cysteine protease
MLIRYGFELGFSFAQPTMMMCLLNEHPERSQHIRYQTKLLTNPSIPIFQFTDSFGNQVRKLMSPMGDLSLFYDAILEDDGRADPVAPEAQEVPLEDVPNEYLVYLLGSRYCETDRLGEMAWAQFGSTPRGWQRVQAICDFVNGHLTFGYQFARATRTAYEAYQERVGVCRDFAHLAVALCRCMNIPARYANGFLGDIGVPADPAPMDYNAWFEAYLDGQWYTFDARHNIPRIGRITVARGRDATDISLANSFGPHVLNQFKVWTEEVSEDLLWQLTKRSA